jgi:hypothetical protein
MINQLKEHLKLEFLNENEFKYQDSFEENKEFIIIRERILDELQCIHHKNNAAIYFKWLQKLSFLHYEYAIFSHQRGLTNKTLKHFQIAISYGYHTLKTGSQYCGCFETINPFFIQNKAVFHMSNLLLTNNVSAFQIIGDKLIESLNGTNCIIKRGYKDSSISWLILKLYSKFSNKEIQINSLLEPNLDITHQKVIAQFDTTNTQDVKELVYSLCDKHIKIAKENYIVHYEEQYGAQPNFEGLTYKELFLVSLYLLPYEVLVWLKLRELHGLQNPKQLQHPLLETDISLLYKNLGTINLENNLPYKDELFDIIKSYYK